MFPPDYSVSMYPQSPVAVRTKPQSLYNFNPINCICSFQKYFDYSRAMVAHSQPLTGILFARNQFDTCRVNITNSATAILPLTFPSGYGDGSVRTVDDSDGSWKQKQRLGPWSHRNSQCRRATLCSTVTIRCTVCLKIEPFSYALILCQPCAMRWSCPNPGFDRI